MEVRNQIYVTQANWWVLPTTFVLIATPSSPSFLYSLAQLFILAFPVESDINYFIDIGGSFHFTGIAISHRAIELGGTIIS